MESPFDDGEIPNGPEFPGRPWDDDEPDDDEELCL